MRPLIKTTASSQLRPKTDRAAHHLCNVRTKAAVPLLIDLPVSTEPVLITPVQDVHSPLNIYPTGQSSSSRVTSFMFITNKLSD